MEEQYISRNSGQPCKLQHYVAEMMCYRLADKKRVVLPPKFWNLSEWKVFYRGQMVACNALLKLYSPAILLRTLRRGDCQSVFSLRSPYLGKCLAQERDRAEHEQKIREMEIEKSPLTVEPTNVTSRRQGFKQNNRLGDLE